jgi:hypothetical protein
MRDGTGLAKACDFSPERRRKWACGCVSTGRIASALVTSTSDDGKQARNGNSTDAANPACSQPLDPVAGDGPEERVS